MQVAGLFKLDVNYAKEAHPAKNSLAFLGPALASQADGL